ncbi:MAG: hypothetical protein IKA72_03155 [Clostridia bacterium]|nr:hypothetical protein [Clostridia bacterium]
MQSDKTKLYLNLRILFTVLSALCVAAVIPMGVAVGLMGSLIFAGLAFMFYLVMLTFKLKHESLTSDKQTKTEPNETSIDEEGDEK